MRIQVCIKGQIDEHWSTWFEDLDISHDSQRDETLLCGEVLDQAALYGLLAKLRDLGLGLLSVTVSDAGSADNAAVADSNLEKGAPDKDHLGSSDLDDAEALDT